MWIARRIQSERSRLPHTPGIINSLRDPRATIPKSVFEIMTGIVAIANVRQTCIIQRQRIMPPRIPDLSTTW